MAYYYNNIETSKLINSPQFTEIFTYKYYIDGEITESKLNEIGVYYEDNTYFKDYTMTVDGKPVVVQWRMKAIPIVGVERYEFSPRGINLSSSMEEFINNATIALGYKVDDATSLDIKTSLISEAVAREYDESIDVEKNVINGVIDLYGKSSYDKNLIDVVFDYFEQYPNISNPYTFVYKPLPEGYSFITSYDHSNYRNNLVSQMYDSSFTGLNGKKLENIIDLENENVKRILNYPFIRTCFRETSANGRDCVYMYGYNVANNSVVTTNEGDNKQHYGLRVTSVDAMYTYVTNNVRIYEYWQASLGNGYEIVSYNYKRDNQAFRVTDGIDHDATVSGTIIDSIGSASTLSYITPISDRHDKWYSPSAEYVPVGSDPTPGTEPTIEVQTIIREGTPIKIYIPPNPIEGVTPYPDIDEPSPPTLEDDVPNASWGMGNMYHPTNEELDKFYEWIWDRDTWHEKQELNANPLEAVISCHTLPLPQYVYLPKTGGDSEWVTRSWYDSDPIDVSLGFMTAKDMSSGDNLQSARVPYRYAKYSFGYVDIPRTYRDYRDFDREIYIFLPYIGFRQLRCDDVTAYKGYFSTRVYLDYVVDISTGDFVAEISIDRNTADRKLLYTFNGNMATVLPISATDKTALSSIRWSAIGKIGASALSGAIAAGSLYFSGGTLTPIAGGALASAVANMYSAGKDAIRKGTDNTVAIQRSDSLSGSFGAMTPRTPYIVVTSNIAYDTNYAPFSGDSANVTIQLGQLKGFTQCKYVHVDTLNYITEEERKEIESLLTSGVIL